MKIPVHIAEKLLLLTHGETIALGALKHAIIEELISERIIEISGRIQKRVFNINSNALLSYLRNKHGINDLEKYIEVFQKENVERNELVTISSNSKLKKVRTFKGFLITSFRPIQATLNEKPITLNFAEGIFQFIYDFEKFIPDQEITIIGIENPENFRFIEKQKHLFKDILPLFICRYPQNQSKDINRWLQKVPNNYLHFGDFDFAGIGIYLNEYKKYLGNRSSFLVPNNIEDHIIKNGNRNLYNQQKMNFKKEQIVEENLLFLIDVLHRNKKCLEQEYFIELYHNIQGIHPTNYL
jgi:hypothetical protein